MRLGFYQPDIPQNLGAAIRLAACFGVDVDVIEPCGFPLTDRSLRRTAMDYGDAVVVVRHDGWEDFLAAPARRAGRLVLFSTRAPVLLQDFAFEPDDTLLFGRESAGAPDSVHQAATATIRIPLAPGVRSLNVVMSAGIALWEARRQTGVPVSWTQAGPA